MVIEVFETKRIEEETHENNIFNFNIVDSNKTIKECVKQIIERNNLAMKNDLVLYLECLRILNQAQIKDWGEHITIKINKEDLNKIIMPSSVSRCRRELKSENEIFYDKKTEEKRERLEKEHKEYYSKKSQISEYNNQFTTPF